MILELKPPYRGCQGVDGCYLLKQRGTISVDPMSQTTCPKFDDVRCWFREYQADIKFGYQPVIFGDPLR